MVSTFKTRLIRLLISPVYLMSFTKFNDFHQKCFIRANSQIIDFLEKSCDGNTASRNFISTSNWQFKLKPGH